MADTLAWNLALNGDAKGNYRVLIVGNSGSGKSTVAKELSQLLKVRILHLDAVFWQANWTRTPVDDARKTIRKFAYHDNWVVDGNATGHLVQARATDVIWLDPPLLLYFPRLLYRSVLRLFNIGDPPAPGCEESVRRLFFSSDSILWYAFVNHRIIRARFAKLSSEDEPGKWRVFTGFSIDKTLKTWLQRVK